EPQPVMNIGFEVPDYREGLLGPFALLVNLGLMRDDQGRARLIDQHTVGFVDYGKMQPSHDDPIPDRRTVQRATELKAQKLGAIAENTAIAQIVKSGLLVAGVDNVPGVDRGALGRLQRVGYDADGKAEEAIDGTQRLRVSSGQVFVDRDHMHRQV